MFFLTDRWVALGFILALILVPFWCPLALEKPSQSVQVSVFSSFGPFMDGDLFQVLFLDRFLVDLGGHLAPKREQIGSKSDFWRVGRPIQKNIEKRAHSEFRGSLGNGVLTP